jgi:hypothetical protein
LWLIMIPTHRGLQEPHIGQVTSRAHLERRLMVKESASLYKP